MKDELGKLATHPVIADELGFYLGKASEAYAGQKTPMEVAELILSKIRKDREAWLARQPMNVINKVLADYP